MDKQLSLFDEGPAPKTEITLPSALPCETESFLAIYGGRNSHYCSSSEDCSHCYVEHLEDMKNHHILGRKNVHHCKHLKAEYKDFKFHKTCEITGNKWEGRPWSYNEDYEKNPIRTPCDFCELVSCNNCSFRNNNPEDPFGCCASCAYKDECAESKWKEGVTI